MKISALITAYNEEKHIEECLKTTIAANPDEIVVVDDGSIDNTSNIIKRIKKQSKIPLKFIKIKNSGQDKARNKGLKHISGDVVCLLDADMIIDKNYFKNIRKEIKNYDMLDLKDIPIITNWVSEYVGAVKRATKRPCHAMTYKTELLKTELLKEGFSNGYYCDSVLTKKLLEKRYKIGVSKATVYHHVHTDYQWFFNLGLQMIKNYRSSIRTTLRVFYSLSSFTPIFFIFALYRAIKLKNSKVFLMEWLAKIIESFGIIYGIFKRSSHKWT